MISATSSAQRYRCVAVSTPGGSAPHFRVQYRLDPRDDWRLSGSFRVPEDAHRSLVQLQRDGFQARLIQYRICPATM